MLKRIWLLGAFALSLSLISVQAFAQEALCAEVKIEILQELTMERQGFEALMRITNSLDSFSLENVSVSVQFADANGNPVVATSNTSASNAAFFIRIDDTRNFTNLQESADGLVQGGVIAPKQVGELRWLIIPTANAAGQIKDGKLYFVGAQLRYSYGGKEEIVDVAADSIVVKPQPALTLDYFLTKEIIGDDGFTTQIEPPVPYTLGVRIDNTGFGYAKAVKIESAQPRIVENKLGLAAEFKILNSYIADQPAAPTLLINFGTIDPQAVSVGRWIMETNLAGEFKSFTASFTHANELGGELTSLLQATNAHFLVHDVLVNLPGRDSVRDFLAYNEQGDLFVYESENTGLNHALCNHCAEVESATATLSNQSSTSQFSYPVSSGFSYGRVTDPYSGSRVLAKVVRSDGTLIHPQNAWISKERADDNINFNYFINVFDSNTTGAYTLYWGGNVVDQPQPPVIQYVADRVTYEGGSVGFLVQASDPNNTVPVLSALPVPTGATFTNQAANTGVFQWNPAIGQAGIYTLTFVANDGALSTQRTVSIRVNPAYDTDGDGLDDQWELDNFGNLDQDGTGDADSDGRNDLQEFEEGTDPIVAEVIPGTPQILSPIFDADTLDGTVAPLYPMLSVTNGNHSTGIDAVNVIFEIYSDAGLSDLVASASVPEGNQMTSIQLGAEHLVAGASFADNRLYYWRARTRDSVNASLTSAWVKSQFFINTANDSPSTPNVNSPVNEGVVANVSPELIITNASDVDRDRLYYSFELFEEGDLSSPLAELHQLAPGNNGETRWRIPKVLQEDKRYLWQAKVADEHGAEVSTGWNGFLVSMANNAPSKPIIDFPAALAEVDQLEANNSLLLRVNNAVDPERAVLVYYFELDTVNTFDSAAKQVSAALVENQNQTSWLASNLQENTTYFWRVRASDGILFSEWEASQFTISALNEAPGVPVLQNPVSGSVVATLRPLFETNPTVDPEGGVVTYRYQLFSDETLATLIAEKLTTDTSWALDIDLSDTATYYWRVRAEDVEGLEGPWSIVGSFTVTLPVINQAPELSFVLPATATTVESDSLLLQWVDSDPDSSATINFYYQTQGGTPELIAANINEDNDGEGDQYQWDTSALAPGEYTISATIADEENTVTANLCCVITVPERETGPVYEPGLIGHYYGYQPSLNGGLRMSRLFRARAVIENSEVESRFTATTLNYALGTGNLGTDNHLYGFLGSDSNSIRGVWADTDCAILHMNGFINLAAGSYNLRVRADDGYSISINGNVIAEYDYTGVPTTRIHDIFNIAEGGRQTIEIVYWDDSERYEFGVEISDDGGLTYHYISSAQLSHLPTNDENVAFDEPETVTYESGLFASYFSYASEEHGRFLGGIYGSTEVAHFGSPDAHFIATLLQYAHGLNNLGAADHLQQFLGVDAASLTSDPRETDNAVIRFEGTLSLDPGTYQLRVKADDGYRILLNGSIIGEYTENQAAVYRTHDPFIVYNDQRQDLEIIYWDASEDYEFGVEISDDGGLTYRYLDSDVLSHPIYHDDIYTLQRTNGKKILNDRGGNDTLTFGNAISAEQLWFAKIGSDLVVTVIGTEDVVRIKGWYLNSDYYIESFELVSGESLGANNVQALVDAMSSLAPPAIGETTLSTEYLDQLGTVIDTNWN